MAKKLKSAIKSVTFRANVPVSGQYQHVHVEAAADVAPGDSPSDVIDMLKDFVRSELLAAKNGEPMPKVIARRTFRI